MPTSGNKTRALFYWVALIVIVGIFLVSMIAERQSRVDAVCDGLERSQVPLRGIIRGVSEPVPVEGLSPERRAVVEQANADRAAFRQKYLPKTHVTC